MENLQKLNILKILSLLVFAFIFTLAPTISHANLKDSPPTEAVVEVGKGITLNVRISPSLSGKIIGSLADQKVVKYQPSGVKGWAKVTSGKLTGYSSSEYLFYPKDEAIVTVGKGATLNVRTSPSISGKVTASLADKQKVEIQPSGVNGWAKVIHGKGTGYSSMTYLESASVSAAPAPTPAPAPAPAPTPKPVSAELAATVTVGEGAKLNMRSAPNLSGKVVGLLSDKQVVKYESSGVSGWAKVTANNVTGYSSTKYLSEPKEAISKPTPVSSSKTATVTVGPGAKLNMRSAPSISGKVLGLLSDKQVVKYESSGVSGWAKVTANNVTGFASTKYLSEPKEVTPAPAPAPAPALPTKTATVKVPAGDSLNVRNAAGIHGKVVGKLANNQVVHYETTSVKGWLKVVTDKVSGYSSATYLDTSEKVVAPVLPAKTATVTVPAGDVLNVRNAAGIHGKIVGTLANKQVVHYETTNVKGWVKVVTDKVTGYSSSDYLLFPGSQAVLPLKGKVVVLDPGHGGYDNGASYGGLYEDALNLTMSLKIKKQLEQLGATVHMTRSADTHLTLTQRVSFSKSKNPDIFVSMHVNASVYGNLHGTETFYNTNPYYGQVNPYPAQSKALATYIQNNLSALPTRSIGAKNMAFHVLRTNSAPSALVEVAFINHPTDSALLRKESFLNDAASRVVNGIEDYFKR